MKQSGNAIMATRATDALVTFLTIHDLPVDRLLIECRDALLRNDAGAALRIAHGVKPFGMSSLADQSPSPKLPQESPEYCAEVLEALVRHWCVHISMLENDLSMKERFFRFTDKLIGRGRTA